MIKIDSAVKFSFLFPADRQTAFHYYSDLYRLVSHLKYISITDAGPDQEYRLYYNTVELGTYHIHVYADVRMVINPADFSIKLLPIKRDPPVETAVTLSATTTRGYYTSQAFFHEAGEETRIEYQLTMRARPPRPKGMRFMPKRMVDKIAQNITNSRVKEIAQYFIQSSVDAFPTWRQERPTSFPSQAFLSAFD